MANSDFVIELLTNALAKSAIVALSRIITNEYAIRDGWDDLTAGMLRRHDAPFRITITIRKGTQMLRNLSRPGRWQCALGASMVLGLISTGAAHERTMVAAKSASDYGALRAAVVARGDRIVRELRQIGVIVVDTDSAGKQALAANAHAAGVARDRIVQIVPKRMESEFFPAARANPLLAARLADNQRSGQAAQITPDPASSFPGLMWTLNRIDAPAAWKTTTGAAAVRVGVADTGLDYTHSELAGRVEKVVDFTHTEHPKICKSIYGYSDADWAKTYGGPVDTDWNGHGSWIGGNIGGALDGVGVNGIAPNVTLVALKISQWCGSAYDSEIIDAFLYAADHGIDIVSISFGGYLDRSDPEQNRIYRHYVNTVAYARAHGTVIVAAAGNEHVRVGANGRVLSHGSLTIPGDPLVDLYGLYENPGGVPGVVDVSSTGNVVEGPRPHCPDVSPDNTDATCKPVSDAHQPTGIGMRNQLAYYSNYGPRIDVAGPGGARKFNVPSADRGGTGGFPYTMTDGHVAFEDFSITSNWALLIPCFTLPKSKFYKNECYSTIQGTSMATPHASAVLALIASARPELRHNPDALVRELKADAKKIRGNTTAPLSPHDKSPGDRTGIDCTTGFCHLGDSPVVDEEAYGAGLVDAADLAH
jgi:lantibiotic leader peptide-processing serine protease